MLSFSYFANSLLLVSLQAALGRPLKTSFRRRQNAVMSTTSLDLGDPRNLPNVHVSTSSERLSVIISLPESNYVTSVHLMCRWRRVIRKNGMMKWLAKRRPKLTPGLAAKRLSWAKECENWTAEDFEGVIWSDECFVEKLDDAHQVWVFKTPLGKWRAECTAPKKGGKEVSVVLWSRFGGEIVGLSDPLL